MSKLLTPFILIFCVVLIVNTKDIKSFSINAQEKKSPALIKQEKILADISFDQVVLYAIYAAEKNYKFKKELIPEVHWNDYYTVVLNTAKRQAITDKERIALRLQQATQIDSTENKKEE